MMPFLAQSDFTPISPATQLALYSAVTVVGQIVAIWVSLRRRPPIEADLVKINTELKALERRQINFEKRHIDEMELLNGKLTSMSTDLNKNTNSIERALGRLEGRTESHEHHS